MSEIANSTVPAGSSEQWRDQKRFLWLIGLVVPSLAFVGYGAWLLTGLGAWFWIGPVVILVVVPLIDLGAGLDRTNPPDDVIEALENDKYYRWITYLFLPIQYAAFVGGCYLLMRGDPVSGVDLALWEKIGLATSIGSIGGIGINTAHELGHKKESHERWLSKIALAPVRYGHFYIEHNRGHHVRVATPEDPASSRFGENFYQFWPRTVGGSLKSAWRLEKRRYARKKQHPFRIGNDVLNAWLMTGVLWGALVAWLGVGLLPYLAIQAVVGFSLLEIVNYMEHYGMLRQKVGVGERRRYERVDPSHSWNSNNIATNVLLYHLQRHSDHHANPTRRYQALRDYEESPVLPTGYAGMMVLALVPPLWRTGDGPAGAGPLPRRPQPCQPQSAQAGPDPGAARRPPRVSRTAPLAPHPPATLAPRPPARSWPRAARAAPMSTRSRPATSTRALLPGPRGPTSPTTGSARTAASATRSTSCRSTPCACDAAARGLSGRRLTRSTGRGLGSPSWPHRCTNAWSWRPSR